MRFRTLAGVAVLLIIGTLCVGSPAQAGGWATTLLDPLPNKLEVGRAYTVGFWVLQHGSHPYDGELGKKGLRLVDAAGRTTEYPGTALPEAAHYAAAVVFPSAGSWRLYGIQGIFADYEIGTANAPGGLTVLPTPPPMIMDDGHGAHWGAVRPLITMTEAHAAVPITPATAAPAASHLSSTSGWLAPAIGGGVMAMAGLVLLWWRAEEVKARYDPGPPLIQPTQAIHRDWTPRICEVSGVPRLRRAHGGRR
ncbi:MAG TPA: hypothetical protein VFG33_09910 [Kribbella sp.]|uniref:hypothetical protein n=1 Tax=Kribbella sp. TaxID=1871183 RepID=UPI002D786F63|nr:hypothetical protein [Kribbella sp.]HET6293682.1 hypothetical protein [Kribbella sp.]